MRQCRGPKLSLFSLDYTLIMPFRLVTVVCNNSFLELCQCALLRVGFKYKGCVLIKLKALVNIMVDRLKKYIRTVLADLYNDVQVDK